MKGCKHVRILLVIGSGDLESRFKGIKKLSNTLTQILPHFDKHLQSIDFCFTKIHSPDKNAIEKIEEIFKQTIKELREKGEDKDEALSTLVTDILDKAKANKLIVLNPMDSNRTQVLRTLFADRNMEWISFPSDEFKPFVTSSSLQQINQQILKHRESIVKSINNYRLIDYKLTQLKRLYNILPRKPIINAVNECASLVGRSWNRRCSMQSSTLKTSISERSLTEFANDIIVYKNTMLDLRNNDEFRQKHLMWEMNDSYLSNSDEKKQNENEKNGRKSLENGAISPQRLVDTLKNQFKTIIDECTIKAAFISSLEKKFGKALKMKEYFPELFKSEFDIKMKKLTVEANNLVKEGMEMIDNDKFKDTFHNLAMLGRAFNVYKKYDNFFPLQQSIKSLESYLISHLKQYESSLGEMYRHLSFEPKTASLLTRSKNMFQSLKGAKMQFNKEENGIRGSIRDQCNEMYCNALECIKNHCFLLADYITKTLWNTDPSNDSSLLATSPIARDEALDNNKMGSVRNYVYYLISLREFDSDIATTTSEVYYRLIQQIIGYLETVCALLVLLCLFRDGVVMIIASDLKLLSCWFVVCFFICM